MRLLLSALILAGGVLVLLAGPGLAPRSVGAAMIKMSLEELSTQADTIVLGTIASQTSAWDTHTGSIYTDVTLTAHESIKGLSDEEITFRITGGVVGEIGMRTSNDPVFQNGERVVIFLNTEETPATVVGLHQGKYTVSNETVTRDRQTGAVADFIEAITVYQHGPYLPTGRQGKGE